jgi:hypothetical protein
VLSLYKLMHLLRVLSGSVKKFDEAHYADHWGHYVTALAAHPRLGAICSEIFERIK